MPRPSRRHDGRRALILGLLAVSAALVGQLGAAARQQCVDRSGDPAGCQPSTFDTPMASMPSVRVNREGRVDPFSSEADAKAGAFALETTLHLFRNFEHLHWVPTVPSVKDSASGGWRGGDLDGAGDGRGLGVAGRSIFVGHGNGPGVRRAIDIFRIQPDPDRQPPVPVGEIPAMVEGNQGFDDRELRSLVYRTSRGEDRQILVRNAGTNTLGRMETYRIDMPREVGHALTIPQGVARTSPVFKDGRPHLLGGQRHGTPRREIHRSARQRAAGPWHRHL